MSEEKNKERGSGSKASPEGEGNPETITVDITPELYKALKEENLRRVPRLARSMVKQYFDFLATLKPDEVLDWMEGTDRLKDLYEKAPFPIKVAMAPARGIIKASRRIRQDADRAINWEVAALTLRFENPACWAVVEAFGEEGIDKLKQGCEDMKQILKIKEATVD